MRVPADRQRNGVKRVLLLESLEILRKKFCGEKSEVESSEEKPVPGSLILDNRPEFWTAGSGLVNRQVALFEFLNVGVGAGADAV